MNDRLRLPLPSAWMLIALTVILAVGGALRLWGLSRTGLIHYDAAHYANAAKTPRLALRWWRTAPEDRPDLRTYLKDRGAIARPAKLLHVAVLALASLVLGIRDNVVLIVSGVFSLLTLLFVYGFGRRLSGPAAGLCAAACLAVSGSSVAFARTGYPQAGAAFLVMLSTAYYLKSLAHPNRLPRSFLAAGGISGVGVLMHPVAGLAIGSFIISDFVQQQAWRSISAAKRWAFRTLALGALLVGPYLLITLAYAMASGQSVLMTDGYLARGVFRTSQAPQLLTAIQLARSGGWLGVVGENVRFLAHMFATLETPVFYLAAIGGCALLGRRCFRSPEARLLLAQIVLAYLYGSLSYASLKSVHVVIPALAIAAGAALGHLVDRFKPAHRPFIVGGVVGIILAAGAWQVRPWVAYRTVYPEMTKQLVAYMREQGGRLCARDQENLREHVSFYFGNAVDSLAPDFKGTIDLHGEGSDYAIIDYQRFSKSDPAKLERLMSQHRVIIDLEQVPRFLPIYHVHRAVPSAQWPSYQALLEGKDLSPSIRRLIVLDLRAGPKR